MGLVLLRWINRIVPIDSWNVENEGAFPQRFGEFRSNIQLTVRHSRRH